jgi:hypothetical protein
MPRDNTAYGPSSNPSSKSYGGGGGGGGVSSGKTTGNTNSGSVRGGSPLAGLANARPTTGVTTGNTIYGNTAYGPSGGMATGYATRTGGMSGMGPSVGTYSNFRNLDGSAAIPGAGNMTAMARNPQQARSVLERQFNPAGRPRVGGLLDGEQVAVGPIPPPRRIVPTAMPAFNKYAALQAYRSPYGPETFATMGRLGQSLFNSNYGAWHDYYGKQPGNEGYERGYGGGLRAPQATSGAVVGGGLGTPGYGFSGGGAYGPKTKNTYGGY